MRGQNPLVLGALLGVLLTGSALQMASATDPVTLDPGFVTDRANALTGSEKSAAEERLQKLYSDTGINLFVVYVDHFTFPEDAADWANETFDRNNLGPHQYLLAVATEGRAYYLAAHVQGELTDAELSVIERATQANLSANDWAGAIQTAATVIESIVGSQPAPSTVQPQNPGATSPPASSGEGGGGVLWLIGMLAFFALIIWLIVRSAKKQGSGPRALVPGAADPYATVSDKDLERKAGSALVQTDDAVTSSREELGFATAQFGDAATATFTEMVDKAEAKLSDAFSLKQKLDDEIPDTPAQRRAWYIEILEFCQAASDLLDDNAQAFAELRQLEQNAPAALENVRTHRGELESKLSAAPKALAALAAMFSPAALNTVADNPQQAESRLALADRGIGEAEKFLGEGKNGGAAFAIRTAEEAVAQGTQLLDAIKALGADLAAVEAEARDLIADLESDLALAAGLPDATGQLAAVTSKTRSQVDQARTHLAGTARDPQKVLATLGTVNTEIDATIAGVRDAVEQNRRRREQVEQKLLQAQTQIRAARDYLDTRRGAVGATPRTRLAEAEASLAQAMSLQAASPEQSLQYATRAYDLARQAISAAEAEIGAFRAPSGSSGMGSDIIGGIIGGIIASSLGGGRSSGGWSSGSSRGSGWSSGGSWSSGGGSRGSGFSPSSFGGARSRSGGGRF